MDGTTLLECDNEHLPMYERHFIKAYDTFGPHGYNATSGGEIGKVFAPVVRQRISSRLKEGWANGSITHHPISEDAVERRRQNCQGTIHFRKNRQKYVVIIPQLWSVENKQQVIGHFVTRHEAEDALHRCKCDVLSGQLYSRVIDSTRT